LISIILFLFIYIFEFEISNDFDCFCVFGFFLVIDLAYFLINSNNQSIQTDPLTSSIIQNKTNTNEIQSSPISSPNSNNNDDLSSSSSSILSNQDRESTTNGDGEIEMDSMSFHYSHFFSKNLF
jgi:hypothetical protein